MSFDTEKITGDEMPWRYCPPPNRAAKILMLTTGKIATLGRWADGYGVIAWCPLPKRDKLKEEELGI